jgi:para-nitrobenzyl esterase
MQRPPFSDMIFRSPGMSEDCLVLNIWTIAAGAKDAKLAILFYIHGGGFLAGDGSEPRHDGAALAAAGIVVVTVNYRLGVFGFFAHPELESANAALFDLAAALDWVRANAAAFGGDPDRITIAGSSSGAYAVCALANSPRSRHKIGRTLLKTGGDSGAQVSR